MMTAGQITLEVVKQAIGRSRKLSARWTFEPHERKHAGLSREELQKKIEETYDRWTWETGSDEDKELLKELEDEREERSNTQFGLEIEKELLESMSDEISKEIDKEILDGLAKS